jgi:hypothetical protein
VALAEESLNGYGEWNFVMMWRKGSEVFRYLYSKEYKNKKKIRICGERQETSNKPLGKAFMDKMS